MIRSQAAYLLPKGYPQETVTAQAPVRFSFLKLQNGRRVLLRANYIGQDPMTQRYNNYFAHVVTDLSADFTAGDAVRKWESSFWLRQDFDGPANLDEPKQISDGSITPRQVAEFARSHKDLVKFILTTLLFGPKNARVHLATNPEQVILSVAVVTQCLPLGLREDLTFSTYEYDPETSFARIVGTCWHESVPHDLSSMAYQPNGGGYNTLTGRKSAPDYSVGLHRSGRRGCRQSARPGIGGLLRVLEGSAIEGHDPPRLGLSRLLRTGSHQPGIAEGRRDACPIEVVDSKTGQA